MDILVATSQGAGLAVACGLAALLPLGVLAVAALLGWVPSSLTFADSTPPAKYRRSSVRETRYRDKPPLQFQPASSSSTPSPAPWWGVC
jgi:hypothetical protein